MSNVIVGELFLDRHHRNLLQTVAIMIDTSEKLKRGVNNACLEHISNEKNRHRSEIQKRLFKKSMTGYRRDISVDYAVKMLIERLVNALRWMRYAFNRPTYTIKTYKRLKKIRSIPVAHVIMPIPTNPYLRIY